MKIIVCHDGDHNHLNDQIKGKLEQGFIPFGIPFSMKDKLCQLMYSDQKLEETKDLISGFKYQILSITDEEPNDMDKGEVISFNCLYYVVYVHWPMKHFQKNLQTILCLKAMFPI